MEKVDQCNRCGSNKDYLFSMYRKFDMGYEKRSKIRDLGIDPDELDGDYHYCLSCYVAVETINNKKRSEGNNG